MSVVDDYQERVGRFQTVLVAIQIINSVLIFSAGVLLAMRVYPAFLDSTHATGRDYISDLQEITKRLSEKEIGDSDTEYLKTQVTKALSLISDNLVDSKSIYSDMRSRTLVGLILLAVGTFIQSLLILFS